ncbi:uncharacterized protein LOC132614018 [Lycium barbarum]|uniref:uncharacterized protein LOC132614018 n=1 Tax=Lycium barbarum TaxID=112863 RepID=UPI00293F11D8|nr:uncharacterized protein LOC132614018 [Lycium barbarum]
MSQASCSSQDGSSKHTCLCGLAANYFTAYTLTIAGRRFYKCPRPDVDSCGYFDWVDPKLPDRAANVICKLKSQVDALKFERQKLKEKIVSLEGIDAVNRERDMLKQKVKESEATNQVERSKVMKLEDEVSKMKAVIVISLFLFACIFSLLV